MVSKSTSLSGWEFLIVWEDLGSSPMFANYVLLFYDLFLIICKSVEFEMQTYVDCVYHQMWIGIVVVLWPYEWKVMGSNLGGQRISFIFANKSLWYECEWVKKSLGGHPRGLGNYQISNIEEELKPKTRFIFKNPLKGTYKSQNLREGV